MKYITRFRGEYRFLSNFYPCEINYEDRRYPSVEHAYQERKTLDPDDRKFIREARSAGEAARRGRRSSVVLRWDWWTIKGDVMRPIVFAKFEQNPDLAQKLLDTGDAILIEGNYWHDNYFGSCSCRECHEGEQPLNILGGILTEVRMKLRGESD